MEKYQLHPLLVIRQPSLPIIKEQSLEDILYAFQDHQLKEKLYTSSPSIFSEYEKWERNELSKKRVRKLSLSLYKYRLRMSYRSTPFGLLSEVQAIKAEAARNGILRKGCKRVSRLDILVVQQLIQKIEQIEALAPFLKYQANDSIYIVDDSIRYLYQSWSIENHSREIKKVDSDKILDQVLSCCKSYRSGVEIDRILEKYCNNKTERQSYFKSLLDQQLLFTNLRVSLSEDDQLGRIIRILQDVKSSTKGLEAELNPILGELVRLQLRLIRLDKNQTNRISAYKALRKQLINMGIELKGINFIQVNQYGKAEKNQRRIEFKIPSNSEINDLLNFLAPLKDQKPNKTLENFKESFKRRYGETAQPILEVMDPEIGLGYANYNSRIAGPSSEILKNIEFQERKRTEPKEESKLPDEIIEKLSNSIRKGLKKLHFGSSSIKDSSSAVDLPSSFSLLIKMVELSDGKQAFLIKDIGGQHASHYIGRFIAGSEKIKSLALEIAKHESIAASHQHIVECFHGSNNRAANINSRPLLYKNSLHYLDNPGERETKLEWRDIKLHLEYNRFTLSCIKSKINFIPRISTALNYSINTLPVHHFIGDMQSQACKTDLNFNWGSLGKQLTHMPRISFENFIIRAEQWVFETSQLKNELNELGLDKWRKKWNIPSECLFVEGDQELLIHFKAEIGRELFTDLIKNKESVLLQEYLKPVTGFIADEKNRDYEHEILLTILNHQKAQNQRYQPLKNLKEGSQKVKRSSKSAWVFFKLYSNPLNTEKVLQAMQPVIESLKRKALINDWFFIRFSDPDHHLRIRFKLCLEEDYGKLLQVVQEQLNDIKLKHLIWKCQLDKYQAEIKRYGENSIEQCERLFHIDSECILRFINSFKGRQIELYRWQFGILLINDWFDLFKLSPIQRKELLELWCENFKAEFNYNERTKASLAKQWRAKKSCINQLISKNELRELNMKVLNAIIAERGLKMTNDIDQLESLNRSRQLDVHPFSLLNSLCHMSCNRLFPHGARAHEFVIYDLLWNYHRTLIGRKNKVHHDS